MASYGSRIITYTQGKFMHHPLVMKTVVIKSAEFNHFTDVYILGVILD